MRFSDIYGQNEVKERLIRSVKEERLAHAILLYGPEGSGKLALAIAFAQYVACTNKKEGDACGECPSCLKYQKLIHPDLHFVFPVILEIHKFSEGGIVEWREQILDTPYFSFEKWSEKLSPDIGNKHANKQLVISVAEAAEIVAEMHKTTFESDYKITIVNFADKMNIQCANKLLKIIEEPFPKTLFIFICDDPNKLLPTITSRLQKIYVPS
ncbi:MAG: DNA polymerase III subunit delta, partial [Paludibacteraceae bacterium]|nr:DNA polymerase III subunit delta [Paludibacteraceae bacterium]